MSVIMENVEIKESEKFTTEMDARFATMVFAEMAVDDAVDILQELSKDEVASFLAIMDKEASQEIKTLLHYEDKTRSEEHTSELQSRGHLVCRLLLEKKKIIKDKNIKK